MVQLTHIVYGNKYLSILFNTLLLTLFYLPLLGQSDVCEEAGFILTGATLDVPCYGDNTGEATVSSTGCSCMFSGCTFTWSNGATGHTIDGLTAGTYQVTVTHPNGCVLTTSVAVEEGSNFIQAVETEKVSCIDGNDGKAKVVPTANAGPLTYEWSTGSTEKSISNVPTGLYTVIITNFAGCSRIETVVIEAEEPATIMVQTTASCENVATGTATVEVSGGTPPYTYNWENDKVIGQPTIENLTAGNYHLKVEDAKGCVYAYDDPITIETVPMETAILTNTLSVCPNTPFELEAIGGIKYTWLTEEVVGNPFIANPLVSIEETTTFEVLIENEVGCEAIEAITIETLSTPTTTISAWNTTIQKGESTQLTVLGATGATFSWSPAEGLSATNVNAPIASPTETTTYTVTATANNGCMTTANITIEVSDITTGFTKPTTSPIRLYPNPTTDFVQLQLPIPQVQDVLVQVYDTKGQIVWQKTYAHQSLFLLEKINLQPYTKGLYYVAVKTKESQFFEKVVLH